MVGNTVVWPIRSPSASAFSKKTGLIGLSLRIIASEAINSRALFSKVWARRSDKKVTLVNAVTDRTRAQKSQTNSRDPVIRL